MSNQTALAYSNGPPRDTKVMIQQMRNESKNRQQKSGERVIAGDYVGITSNEYGQINFKKYGETAESESPKRNVVGAQIENRARQSRNNPIKLHYS